MKVYQTDRHGAYVGEVDADESPLEPGVFLIPAGCVELPPPAVAEGKVAVWEGGVWLVKNVPPPTETPDEQEPPLSDEEKLARERSQMQLSFAQFVVGLTETDWITDAEAEAWLAGNALPAAVDAALAQIPAQAGGQKPRLRARARALRPSTVVRTNELLALMAQSRGATQEQLDDLFRTYAKI
jgi:hypothetical protein